MGANLNSPVNLPARTAQPVSQPAANNAAANNAPAATTAAASAPEHAHSGNQVMGFFEGFVKEGVDTVGGLYTLVTTNPITTAKGLVYMATHFGKATQAITEPYTTAYKEGNYGELAGRLSFQALTFVITAGALKGEKGAQVGKAAEASGKGAEGAAKGAGVAAKEGGSAAAASATATHAEQVGADKALAAIQAKYPKFTSEALQELVNNKKGMSVYQNQYNALAARYTAEAEGMSAEALDNLVKAAGHLPKTDVYKYVRAAAGSGMSEGDISANLAKFAGQAGGKDAMRVAAKDLGTVAAAAPAAASTATAAEAKTIGELTGDAIDGAVSGVKNTVGTVKGAVTSTVDAVKGAGETLGNAVKKTAEGVSNGVEAVKGVYDASVTLGDLAHGVASVPLAIGRGVGSAYNATIGRLIDGIANIRLVNPFHMPNLDQLAQVRIRPLHILAAPITVPLGVVKGAGGLLIHHPIRFMGFSSFVGDIGIAAKKGELLQEAPTDPTPTPITAGFKEYELKEGDTLESIAQKQLGDSARWPEIYQANKELFDSLGPDGVIPSGTKIKIPVAGSADAPAATPDAPAPSAAAVEYKAALLKLIDQHLSTDDAQTREGLTKLKGRLSAMSPEEVLKHKPELEAHGLVVDSPSSNKPGNSPAPTTNTPAPAPTAPTAPVAPPAPTTAGQYTVQRNDSLWSIAQQQLGDANKWRELVRLNKSAHPSLETNPDFIQVGWKLNLPGAGGTTAAPAAASSPRPASASSNNQPAAPVRQPTAAERQQIVQQFGLEGGDTNWNKFLSEVRAYPTTAIGPKAGSAADVKAVQTILGKLGFPVQPTGRFEELGADGKPKLDASGNPVSPTAEAVIAFKKLAGITQSYNVLGADGKPTPDVNAYVDSRTRETMQVSLRLLQNTNVRSPENMAAAVKEAAKLQDSAIGPEVGSREGRKLVQQYLGALGYPAVKPTGEFDQATIDAIVDYKKKNNLPASYKDDKGAAVYTPYVDGPTADAFYHAAQKLKTKQ